MSLKVLGIGDNVCDKYLHTAVIYPGGNALNIAVFARELGHESAYLGTFGDDEVGFHVHDTALSMGIDTADTVSVKTVARECILLTETESFYREIREG